MLKYLLLLLFINSNLLGMIDLSKNQADKTMNFLVGKKAVLLYANGGFKYIKIMNKKSKKGRVSKSNIFDSIHEDEDDYHILINGDSMDLSKVYIRESSKSKKWIRLGSKIDKELFGDSLNDTLFVYQEPKKTKRAEPVKNNLEKVGTVKVIQSMNNSGMTLTVDEDDARFNNAKVYEPLERVKSF